MGACEPAWSLIQEYMKKSVRKSQTLAANFFYTNHVASVWQEQTGWDRALLNFHTPGHITTKLVCDVLPNAPYTCNYMTSRPEPKRDNSRSTAQGGYASIIYAAYEEGLLSADQQRHEILNDMMDYFEAALGPALLPYADLPLKDCPSQKELEVLLNMSLALEQQLLPEWHEQTRAEHVHEFWNMAHVKKEFCAVDTDAALGGKQDWESVLQGLVDGAQKKQTSAPKNFPRRA